ncbi:MAG: SGNH/GDSL hydrolase family protein [Bacillota bacterium]|nr:SGNH/GDSL hydrolase family protein [Bacillota bacterium]
MKKTFLFLFLSVFLLSAFDDVPAAELQKQKKLDLHFISRIPNDFFPRNLKIVTLGDSLTKGIGDSTKKGGYLPYLKSRMEAEKGVKEVDFLRFGVKGNRTTQLLKRLKTKEVKNAVTQADIIIVTVGGNDIMKVIKDNISHLNLAIFRLEKEKYRKHLIRIFDCLHVENPKATIYLVGLYNPFTEWFTEVDELNQVVLDWNHVGQNVVSGYKNARFIPIDDLFARNGTQLLYKDHFHPNDRGYAMIAKRLHDHLELNASPERVKRYEVRKEEK